MVDKSNSTPDEWKLLLESVTMAGLAVSAADPSGLWGLLKESFAEGAALVAAKTDSTTKPLIKAVVADFETSQGRTIARDGLKEKLSGLKPALIRRWDNVAKQNIFRFRLANTTISTGSDRARSIDEHSAHDSDMDSNGDDDSSTLE